MGRFWWLIPSCLGTRFGGLVRWTGRRLWGIRLSGSWFLYVCGLCRHLFWNNCYSDPYSIAQVAAISPSLTCPQSSQSPTSTATSAKPSQVKPVAWVPLSSRCSSPSSSACTATIFWPFITVLCPVLYCMRIVTCWGRLFCQEVFFGVFLGYALVGHLACLIAFSLYLVYVV